MRIRFFGRGVGDNWRVLIVLAIFWAAGVWQYRTETGDDLAASYVGCRLVATGNASHLYSYSPGVFADVGPDTAWKKASAEGNFTGFLHPYVQTPLWAYMLRPLCMRMSFPGFDLLFAGLTMLAFATTLWLIAARWALDLLNPLAMGTICLALWFSEPFRYAMFLMQTHVLFFFLTLAALALAERRPGWAGLLLAIAAAVKITPGFLLIYWLLTRRWRAAASMAGWSAVLAATTVAVAGRALMGEYLAGLHRVGETLLVSLNNQSFAAWCMGRFYATDELYDLEIFPLPTALRVGSMALLLGFTLAGGWIDRRQGEGTVPLGAMMAIVAATVFSPIAWTHYFIVLAAPLMLLAVESRALRSRLIWATLGVVALLNFQPVAAGIIDNDVYGWTVVRSHFYSGVLCLGALGYAAWRRSRATELGLVHEPSQEQALA